MAIVGLMALLVVLLGVLAWAMAMQRKALIRQGHNLYQVDENLELMRRSVEIGERLLRLAEQSVGNQEEVIRLLKELAGRDGRHSEEAGPYSGVQLPDAGPPSPREIQR